MVKMGRYVFTQRKICIYIMASLFLIGTLKTVIIGLSKNTIEFTYASENLVMRAFGFEFYTVDGVHYYDIYGSLDFEGWAFGTTFILFLYYTVMIYGI